MRGLRRAPAPRLAMAAWLLVVWVALWSRLDFAVVASGCLVVVLVYWMTRLPMLPRFHRINPVALAGVLVRFNVDLFVSSLVIGGLALRGSGRVHGGILAVPYRVESDVLLILLANSLSLRPGSLVMEIDGGRSLLYVHGMPIRDRAKAGRVRAGVIDTERRLMRAFSTARPERMKDR